MVSSRRLFLQNIAVLLSSGLTAFVLPAKIRSGKVMTVLGTISSKDMGHTLIHEHLLVDFIGAKNYDPNRWNKNDVVEKLLPHLDEAREAGCKTFIDCTPNYLGRDVWLLQRLSMQSRLNIITNTGYYGGSDNKFLPDHAFTYTVDQLVSQWVKEFREGIDGTAVKPGFIKISVNNGPLTEISQKLIRAAARCHFHTGLTIASHTGPATPAFEQIDILKQEGIAADAFIWVHAQNEKDRQHFVQAAKAGAWVSLDGLSETNVKEYADTLLFLKREKCLHRVLVSHDAGWYDPEKPDGGEIRGYTTFFKKLIPALEQENFTEQEVLQLMDVNPRNAFEIRKRRSKSK